MIPPPKATLSSPPPPRPPKEPSNACCLTRCVGDSFDAVMDLICDIAGGIFYILSYPSQWMCPELPQDTLPPPILVPEEKDFEELIGWKGDRFIPDGTPDKRSFRTPRGVASGTPQLTPHQAPLLKTALERQMQVIKSKDTDVLRKLRVLEAVWCTYYSDARSKAMMLKARVDAFDELPKSLRIRIAEKAFPEKKLKQTTRLIKLLELLKTENYLDKIKVVEESIAKVMLEETKKASGYDFEGMLFVARNRYIAKLDPSTPAHAIHQIINNESIDKFCDPEMSKAWQAWEALPEECDELLETYLKETFPSNRIPRSFLTEDMDEYLKQFKLDKRKKILLDALEYLEKALGANEPSS